MSLVTKRLTQTRSNVRRFNAPRRRFFSNKQEFGPGEEFYLMVAGLWGFTSACGWFAELRSLDKYRRRRGLLSSLFVDFVISAMMGTAMGAAWPISIPWAVLYLIDKE